MANKTIQDLKEAMKALVEKSENDDVLITALKEEIEEQQHMIY